MKLPRVEVYTTFTHANCGRVSCVKGKNRLVIDKTMWRPVEKLV